ncbi:helix-turn-helix domain-containing protein [Nocardia yamanashiensis]|uniref:helix-turn-helix domain-containing protein n=1 Tax=Nocardia yamanashiensis TaxID=209247 RepID=UPI001E63995D|nr:helix-turn-helix domain-containing protein [Nocardia yamanashiensis]UGT45166.1 helix-turn-helix domain-containing protein [Nocardia yamanashiensis]
MTQRRTGDMRAPTGQLMSLREAAALAHVDIKTIRRWIDGGHLAAYRMGPRLLRVERSELLAVAKPVTANFPGGAA